MGLTTATTIEGSLDAKNIVMGVLKASLELTDLKPFASGPIPVPELNATIPIEVTPPEASEDLEEWETTEISGSTFASVEFNLKKDRVLLAVSDEAQYRSKAGDPMAIQKSSGADRLASLLNRKIVRALDTSPRSASKSVGSWDVAGNSPLRDLILGATAIRPYKPTGVLMGTEAFAAYAGNDVIARFGTGNVSQYANAVAVVPGLNIPVYSSLDVDALAADGATSAFIAGANATVLGNGPVKIREEDSLKGGRVYQVDVWRQVVGPVLTDTNGLNKTVCKLTGLVSAGAP